MIEINGSSGGGQLLRTCLAVSHATQRPFRIVEFRARSQRPGLLRHHLAAVRAAESLGGRAQGAELGTTSLTFEPGRVDGGEHHLAVGSGSSACLLLQAILMPLVMAGRASHLVLEGGTHTPHTPPYEFLERALLPLLARMGAQVGSHLERRGFYPAGGGRFVVEIAEGPGLRPLELLDAPCVKGRRATAIIGNLGGDIAVRELTVVAQRLGWSNEELQLVQDDETNGPGNVLLLEVEQQGHREIFAGFGERTVSAEKVAHRAIDQLRKHVAGGASVSQRLAEHLVVPFALVGGSAFRTAEASADVATSLSVIDCFLPGSCTFEEVDGGSWEFRSQHQMGSATGA